MQHIRTLLASVWQNSNMRCSMLLASVAVASILICLLASSKWRADASPDVTYAQTHRGHLKRLDANAAPGRVILLGSSTLQGLDATPVTPFALNLGLGGDTVPQLSQRSKNYHSLQKAAAIVLNIGFNDVMKNCRRPDTELDALFAQFARETPLIVIGLQGVSPKRQSQECAGKITELLLETNIELSRRCAKMYLCLFIQNPLPERIDIDTSNRLHEADGIHLSPMAYNLLRNSLRDALHTLAPELISHQVSH